METPPPNFAADIKPLFRELDRRAMAFLFDLWDYEAVKSNAEAILAVTEAGDMPCDGAWPVERVDESALDRGRLSAVGRDQAQCSSAADGLAGASTPARGEAS